MKPQFILIGVCLALLVFACGDLAGSDDTGIGEKTKFVVVWEGATPLSDALATAESKDTVLAGAFNFVLAQKEYPVVLFPTTTTDSTVRMTKYQCNGATPPQGQPANVCGYWLEASRGDYVVPVDNPVWLVNPPIAVVVSEVYDQKTDTYTVTIREDPFGSIEGILQRVADMTPASRTLTQEAIDRLEVPK